MATITASIVCQSAGAASMLPVCSSRSRRSRAATQKLNMFRGLKATNKVMGLGCSESVDQQFAKLQARCMAVSAKSRRGGGALTSKASVAGEIFKVVPLMSVLVLVGIAIGFLLLRVEQAFEEREE